MAQGLNTFIKSIVGVVFISFLIFAFIGGFLAETNPTSELLSGKYGINSSQQLLNDTIDEYTVISENVFNQLDEDDPSKTDIFFLIVKSAFTIPKTFLSFMFNGVQAISLTLFPTFQGSGFGVILSIGLALIVASLIITAVLLLVRAIRTGDTIK